MKDRELLHYIGHDGERVLDSRSTQRQIDRLKTLRCELVTDNGEPISWADFDNPDEPRTLFQFILSDHRLRVDESTSLANQPPLGVATVVDGACIRFEFYEGHQTLKKTYDLRSNELCGEELTDSREFAERSVPGSGISAPGRASRSKL